MISLFASASATLRIVGLATVMQGNPGIDVVMPRVDPAKIEAHITGLILRNEELVASSTAGWKTKPWPPNNQFTFVDLTGEDVQFAAGAANPVASVPSQLPRLTNGCIPPIRANEAVLVMDKAILRPPLHESYKPPFYPAAAAVLRVPYGATTACLARVRNENRGRIDTNVVWVTGGEVTIVGEGQKRLRLKGNRVLIVAGNIPTALFTAGHARAGHGMDHGHFKAYYTMLLHGEQQGCVRQAPAAGIRRCPESSIAAQRRNSRVPVSHRRVPHVVYFATSECSNSQYP
jgi:hypothetical protein